MEVYMDILVLKAWGKYAHFRKVYSNSSSLSYYAPPRSTVCGMLAAVLGLERDSYYDAFSPEKVKIAVKIASPLRKMVHTVNYIYMKGMSDLINRKQGTQVPFEIVAGNEDSLCYHIYVAMEDEAMFHQLADLTGDNKSKYPPALGAAPFLCCLEHAAVYSCERIRAEEAVEIHSIAALSEIEENSIVVRENRLVKEDMPFHLKENRLSEQLKGYIFDYTGKPLIFIPKNGYYGIEGENIVFM